MNYYRRYVGDYLRDTPGLSLAEHGAYTIMLDTYYATMMPLPAGFDSLYRLCRALTKPEQAAVRSVAEAFFPLGDDGKRHNKRADSELAKAGAAIDTQRMGGSAGGRSKWGSTEVAKGNPAAVRRERMRKARELGTHTPGQWSALVSFCGGRCVRCGSMDGLVRDHITPVYQGGSDAIENIQPLCKTCNSSKGPDCTDMRPDGWLEAVLMSSHPSDSDSRSDSGFNTSPCLHPPTTNQKTTSKDLSGKPDEFELFWAAYPRKEAKAKARPAFAKQRAGRDLPAILADLRSRADEWRDRQFIPLPASYLNARRWEDERELAAAGAEFGGGAL